ncbi:hypothetical protein DL770_003268 [Monosporascus sp. CRB-9-2]|nr:hypothetical protein DL770_003268 [Monosporascus sp. CRB-9-2]
MRPSTSTQNGLLAEEPKGKGSSKALPKAPSGRPYTSWKLPSGKEISMRRALLPDNYQMGPDPQLPWTSHAAELFNDNLDGTLSLVGRRAGIGKVPATVVSRRRQPLESGRASVSEPSLSPPYLPSRTNTQGSQATPSASSPRPEPQKPAQAAVVPPDRPRADRRSLTLDFETPGSRSLWNQIKPHIDRLPLSIRHDSTGGFLGKLLAMPRIRDLQIEPEATDTFKATTQYDIPSLALYLTGMEAPCPCFRCLCRKGPFKGCIVVHPAAPVEVRNEMKCCANCFYKGHGDSCGVDASLIHGQRNPDTATSTEELPSILEEGAIDTWHEPHTPILPKQTPAPGGPNEPARPEMESFSEIAVECFASKLRNNKQDKAALLPAASVTAGESSNPANSNASAQSLQNQTNGAVPDLLTSAPEAEPDTPPRMTPSRRSPRLVVKSSTRASSATPAPKTPERRKQLSIRIPETPPSSSAQHDHDRVQDQDPDLSPVSATRRSERLRTKTPATPSKPGGLHSPTASTEKQSSTNKRKLKEVETGSGGAATNRARFKRREIHLGSSGQASLSGSSALSPLAPPTPVSAVSPQHRYRDALELEDWEIAPGRVRSGQHNIAFSTSYLRTAKPVPVHPGIGFHVVTLYPGKSFRLEAQADRVRVVSIARGKVRVRFPEKEEFAVDADGAVKVPPDTACVLQNRLAVDATLHVCSLHQPRQA